jgi:hypothetical protein
MSIWSITLCLATCNAFAQTWPDSTCPDKPYTKGNDGIIYHTCICGVSQYKVGKDGLINGGGGTVTTNNLTSAGTWGFSVDSTIPSTKYYPRKKDESGIDELWEVMNGKKVKWLCNISYKSKTDCEFYCPYCDRMVDLDHIESLLTNGMLLPIKDQNGNFTKNDMQQPFSSGTGFPLESK